MATRKESKMKKQNRLSDKTKSTLRDIVFTAHVASKTDVGRRELLILMEQIKTLASDLIDLDECECPINVWHKVQCPACETAQLMEAK
jgi:hypothetical protein